MSEIIRTKKGNRDHPWVVIDKRMLLDKELSLKAKGLLAFLLSKPDDWQVYIRALANELKESKDTIAGIINELIAHRYVKRKQLRNAKGEIEGYEYTIYEVPYPNNPDTGSYDILSKDITKEIPREGTKPLDISSRDEVLPPPLPSPTPKKAKTEDVIKAIKEILTGYVADPGEWVHKNQTKIKELLKTIGAQRFCGALRACITSSGKLMFFFDDFVKWRRESDTRRAGDDETKATTEFLDSMDRDREEAQRLYDPRARIERPWLKLVEEKREVAV